MSPEEDNSVPIPWSFLESPASWGERVDVFEVYGKMPREYPYLEGRPRGTSVAPGLTALVPALQRRKEKTLRARLGTQNACPSKGFIYLSN